MDKQDQLIDCQDCGGNGWVVGMGCCGGSGWECGASGCSGPIQVQECCQTCGGAGGFPLSAAIGEDGGGRG